MPKSKWKPEDLRRYMCELEQLSQKDLLVRIISCWVVAHNENYPEIIHCTEGRKSDGSPVDEKEN